jgi:hypothetical protein
MPYTACAYRCRCSEPSALVKARSRLPVRYRCCPLMSPGSRPKTCPKAPLGISHLRAVLGSTLSATDQRVYFSLTGAHPGPFSGPPRSPVSSSWGMSCDECQPDRLVAAGLASMLGGPAVGGRRSSMAWLATAGGRRSPREPMFGLVGHGWRGPVRLGPCGNGHRPGPGGIRFLLANLPRWLAARERRDRMELAVRGWQSHLLSLRQQRERLGSLQLPACASAQKHPS